MKLFRGAITLNNQDIGLIIRIAKKYYELNMGQEQIAASENISKSTVSRMLRKATDLKYVNIEINYPLESITEIEEKFKSTFPIPDVFVCPAYTDDYIVRTNDTCRAVAQDVSKLVKDNEVIGVSWGTTIDTVSSYLVPPNPPKRNIKIVQLHGSVVKNISASKFPSIIQNFSDAFLGTAFLLPSPLIVDTKEIAEAIMSDSHIQAVFDIIKQSDIAVVGIGEASSRSVLVERGIYTIEEYNNMDEIGVVGDICGRYVDINGNPGLAEELSNRTIAVTIDDLKKKKHRIGVAIGENKTRAIIGALNSGMLTSFYIDEITAREVLHQYDRIKMNY